VGLLRICRDEDQCTQCGSCDSTCEWGVRVSQMRSVTSVECGNCQDCITGCPVPGTLSFRIGPARS
jgi:MinD superfamily P-loop ATPase